MTSETKRRTPLTAAEREPKKGDMLSCPPHPVDRRQVRPVKEVAGVDVFDGKKGLIIPRYSGSKYADIVTEDKWEKYFYVSRADGGNIESGN